MATQGLQIWLDTANWRGASELASDYPVDEFNRLASAPQPACCGAEATNESECPIARLGEALIALADSKRRGTDYEGPYKAGKPAFL